MSRWGEPLATFAGGEYGMLGEETQRWRVCTRQASYFLGSTGRGKSIYTTWRTPIDTRVNRGGLGN